MLPYLHLPLLLAQQTAAAAPVESNTFDTLVNIGYFLLGVFVVLVAPYFAGKILANGLRAREYGWRIGLIFVTLACGVTIMGGSWNPETHRFNIPQGVDLKGGVILIYEAQEPDPSEENSGEALNMADLVTALTNRINPSGTKEIVVRQYGERQVEIIIPEVDPIEVAHVKRQIDTAGALEFRIVANRRDHESIMELARQQAIDPNPAQRLSKKVMQGKKEVGKWVQGAREQLSASEVFGTMARNALTGEILDFQQLSPIRSNKELLGAWLDENGIKDIDILVVTDQDKREVVVGEDLGVVSGGVDEVLNPCVKFRLKTFGAQKFRLLTSQNTPSTDTSPPFYRHLGIVLDERLLSFPRIITTISDSGQITGNFDQEEVDFLVGVLRAGRLPAALKKEPISENQIGSMLGDDTIIKGERAIVISLVAVLAFVAFYYRFAGLVACAALLFNLLLIMALMVLLKAPLTLPGLAGLVLTVGMSVDANVLIYERIREELQHGSALRMAIRNGFGRATTTIVDANLTTLITAIVLYVIGTDQIRGFAVTLIFGILMSMYTAIFCSRVVFDIAERRRWLTQMKMMQIIEGTNINFLGMRSVAVGGSLLLIVVGLVAIGFRGQDIFDIDFTGGTSVTMVLNESMPPDEVRGRLGDEFAKEEKSVQFSVNTISVEQRPDDSVYKIDADVETVDALEKHIIDAFKSPGGESLLLSYTMKIEDLKQVRGGSSPPPKAQPAPETQKPAAQDTPAPETQKPAAQDTPAPETQKPEPAHPAPAKTSSARALPSDRLLAWAGPVLTAADPAEKSTSEPADTPAPEKTESAPEKTESAPEKTEPAPEKTEPAPEKTEPAPEKTEPAPEKTEPAPEKTEPAPEKTEPAPEKTEPAPKKAAVVAELRSQAHLTFGDPINAPTLLDALRNAATAADRPLAEVVVDTDQMFNWEQDSAVPSSEWYVEMVTSRADANVILKTLQTTMSDTPVWPTSTRIGGKVAGDTQNLAIAALLSSLLGIIAYIWIRFQHVVFGVAAVIALVHDVLVTLGAIAISAWLAKPLGFLLVEEFKISLPIVAALLTIIGYSLNDTIVVFDRIREVRGKSPRLTLDMLNLSINQTLSRTLLTSLTTLIVVVILYFMGGQGIHGFAFALVVGVVVGTYSSIFIASPALLWMMSRTRRGRDAATNG